MQMTRIDIRNYLEKIYKIPIVQVNTRVAMGKTRRNQVNYIVKDDDYKVAYVQMVCICFTRIDFKSYLVYFSMHNFLFAA